MKLYAILVLTNLNTKQFDSKDDWVNAIRDLRQRNITVIALRWHPEVSAYVRQEERTP